MPTRITVDWAGDGVLLLGSPRAYPFAVAVRPGGTVGVELGLDDVQMGGGPNDDDALPGKTEGGGELRSDGQGQAGSSVVHHLLA